MRHLRGIRTLILSGVVALAGLTWAAAPAYASPVSAAISASGGPGVVGVDGYGFTPGANVDLNILSNPNMETLEPEVTVQANQYGYISWDFHNLNSGAVLVAADQMSPAPELGTLWAEATVSPPPQFSINGTGQARCGLRSRPR